MKVVDKRFTFMESYLRSIDMITDHASRLDFLQKVIRYGLYQEMPAFDNDFARGHFEEIRAHIDLSINQRETNRLNGKKGGAPSKSMIGNQNARKHFDKTNRNKPKQTETKVIEYNGIELNGIEFKSNRNKLYSGLPSVLVDALNDFEKMRVQIKKPVTDRAREMILKKLHVYSNGDLDTMIEILNQSIVNDWSSIYPLNQASSRHHKKNVKTDLSPTDMLEMYKGKE